MYLLRVESLESEDPVYQRLPGGRGHFFIPEARVARDYARTGLYEGPLIDWVMKNFVREDQAVVDIGAHVGHYAVNLGHKASRVYAFECSPKSFNYLCANIALQGLDYKVEKFNVALSSQPGTARYFIRDPLDGGSNGITPYEGELENGDLSLEVETRTLDSFGLRNVGFLKLDVENHEKEVLQGAVKTLRENDFPPFIFESWDPHQTAFRLDAQRLRDELFGFIAGLGYQIQPIAGWVEGEFLAMHPTRRA